LFQVGLVIVPDVLMVRNTKTIVSGIVNKPYSQGRTVRQ